MSTVHKRRGWGGFTVIEVLTAVIVVTMIVSLLLPALSYSQHASRTGKGLANLKEIGELLRLYAIDNNSTLPWGYFPDGSPPGFNETDWRIITANYLDGKGNTYQKRADANASMPSIFYGPNAAVLNVGISHYTSHPLLMATQEWEGKPLGADTVRRYRLTRMNRPADVVLVMDGLQDSDAPTAYDSWATASDLDNDSLDPTSGTYDPIFNLGDPDNDTPIDPGDNLDIVGTVQRQIVWRQQRGTAANLLFSDGHVATKTQGEVLKRHIRIDN